MAQVFFCEFWEIFYTFSIEHLRWLLQKFFENEQTVCTNGEKRGKRGNLPVGREKLTSLLRGLSLCLVINEFLKSCLYVNLLRDYYFMQKWVVF